MEILCDKFCWLKGTFELRVQITNTSIGLDGNKMFLDITTSVVTKFWKKSIHESAIDMMTYDMPISQLCCKWCVKWAWRRWSMFSFCLDVIKISIIYSIYHCGSMYCYTFILNTVAPHWLVVFCHFDGKIINVHYVVYNAHFKAHSARTFMLETLTGHIKCINTFMCFNFSDNYCRI